MGDYSADSRLSVQIGLCHCNVAGVDELIDETKFGTITWLRKQRSSSPI